MEPGSLYLLGPLPGFLALTWFRLLAHIQRELQGLDSGPFIETGASGSIKTKINFSPKACQQAEAPSMSWLEPLAAEFGQTDRKPWRHLGHPGLSCSCSLPPFREVVALRIDHISVVVASFVSLTQFRMNWEGP